MVWVIHRAWSQGADASICVRILWSFMVDHSLHFILSLLLLLLVLYSSRQFSQTGPWHRDSWLNSQEQSRDSPPPNFRMVYPSIREVRATTDLEREETETKRMCQSGDWRSGSDHAALTNPGWREEPWPIQAEGKILLPPYVGGRRGYSHRKESSLIVTSYISILLCCPSKTYSFVLELATTFGEVRVECMDLSSIMPATLPTPPSVVNMSNHKLVCCAAIFIGGAFTSECTNIVYFL